MKTNLNLKLAQKSLRRAQHSCHTAIFLLEDGSTEEHERDLTASLRHARELLARANDRLEARHGAPESK